MEQERTFITSLPEKPKSAEDYLKLELLEDLESFPDSVRPLVEWSAAGRKLRPEQQKEKDRAVNRWWEEKYGFPFGQKVARQEVLWRKYSPSETQAMAQAMFSQLIAAMPANDEILIQSLKEKYQQEFPEELEGLEVMFGLRQHLRKQWDMNNRQIPDRQERRQQFRDFTEFQFLLTHYILFNGGGKDFMKRFWAMGQAIADRTGTVAEFNALRRGAVSQVAVHRIMTALGYQPKLAHPEEDAFQAIDLWTDEETAIQIKGWDERVPAVIKSDHLAMPAIATDTMSGRKKRHLYNSLEYFKRKDHLFRARIKEYGALTNRSLTGWMLAVPSAKIDFVTGQPDPKLIEFFRNELAEAETLETAAA